MKSMIELEENKIKINELKDTLKSVGVSLWHR